MAELGKSDDALVADTYSAQADLKAINDGLFTPQDDALDNVDSAITELDKISTQSLDLTTYGAENLIGSAVGKVSDVTPAPEADRYTKFAEAKVNIAMARASAASQYVAACNGRVAVVESFIKVAAEHINQSNSFIANAQQLIAAAYGNIEAGNGFIAIADRYISEASIRVNNSNIYVVEADGRFNMAQAYVKEAELLIYEVDRLIQKAGQYSEVVQGDLVISDRYRTEGQLRLNEFHNKLQVKSEYRKRTSSVPNRQPA
jgi:hypothetical protein